MPHYEEDSYIIQRCKGVRKEGDIRGKMRWMRRKAEEGRGSGGTLVAGSPGLLLLTVSTAALLYIVY